MLRDAAPGDVATIASLVKELATYEKLDHEARATAEDFRVALFGPTPRASAILADVGGYSVGFALYFFNFSTFVGRHGLYVEDVFVQAAYRGRGIGRAFFQALAARAIAEGCGRMEWAVLDWNRPAVEFYRALGAVAMNDWTVQRLAGAALLALAGAVAE